MKKNSLQSTITIVILTIVSFFSNAQTFRERVLPTEENFGFHQDNYWTWCGSVIKGEDGKYHMFASRWSKKLSFEIYWLTNSEIVHAVSDKPEGPYTFSDVVLQPRGEQFWDGK